MSARPAAFLDRDGVINEDHGYAHRTEDLVILPGVPEALARLQRANYLLIVVTNQSGIDRGYFGEADLAEFHRHITRRLSAAGVVLDAIYHCPHLPDAGCDCRKPMPGMLLRAFSEFEIDASRSCMVGDKPSDVEAGRAAGIGTGYLIGSSGISSLADCVNDILARDEVR